MIYDNIIRLVEQKNLTIHALEERAGLSNGTVRKWRRLKHSPRLENVVAVAKVLGVSINELYKAGT